LRQQSPADRPTDEILSMTDGNLSKRRGGPFAGLRWGVLASWVVMIALSAGAWRGVVGLVAGA
jgi:hypothetical protein